MQKRHFMLSLLTAFTLNTYAATTINLTHHSLLMNEPLTTLKEVSRHVDANQVVHIRVEQRYAGYPVWGSDAVLHTAQKNVDLKHLTHAVQQNGVMFQGLYADLKNTPSVIFNKDREQLALKRAQVFYQEKTGIKLFKNVHQNYLMVYVDTHHKAHFAYYVSFLSQDKEGKVALPTYILDAQTFTVYEAWNNLQALDEVTGGGNGGNPKLGEVSYDGLPGDRPVLKIERDAKKHICYLENHDVTVKNDTKASGPFSNAPIAQFPCTALDANHQNLYWDSEIDAVNGGYSPSNDALYIGQVVKDMYQKWYHVPVLQKYGYAFPIVLHAHAKDLYGQPMDNAFFFPLTMQMYFGDGVKLFYPLTSLGVGAHELSHGFTSSHANLTYQKQSGGLNESFSDMAACAAEFFAYGKTSWQIGAEIMRENRAIRYMDDPTKDGHSIAHIKDYDDSLNVHYTSGVFNKAYYLLSTSSGYDPKRAFDVMVKANMDYWTANSTFLEAACGVLSAAKDLNYPVNAIFDAFKGVGIDVNHC